MSLASEAEARSPVVHRPYSKTFHVRGNSWDCVSLTLKANQRYLVTIEHVQPEIYPAVVRPGFYDMKLHLKRYWHGQQKFASGHLKGTSRIRYAVTGTHHGDREFKFCVYNALPRHKEFRIVVVPLR